MSASESRHSAAPPTPDALEGYTAVSAFAVGSLIIAVATAGVVGALSWASRSSGKPAYLPLMLLPCVMGFVLGIIAHWRVSQSEGVLTGLGMAKAAWILSLFTGGAFAAYVVATEIAIRNQARDFTLSWLQKLGERKTEAAFLDATDPGVRSAIGENDTATIRARYGYTIDYQFGDNDVVRLMTRAGKDYVAIPRGNRGWQHERGGFAVRQVFEIHTPEGHFMCTIPAFGQDRRDLAGRMWQVMFSECQIDQRRTTSLGRLLLDAQFECGKFIRSWVQKIDNQQLEEAFLETMPKEDRDRLRGKVAESPEYKAFIAGSLISVDGPVTDAERKKYAETLVSKWGVNVSPGTGMGRAAAALAEVTGDKITIRQTVEVNLDPTTDIRPIVAEVTMECRSPKLSAAIKAMTEGDWKSLPILPPSGDNPVLEIDQYPDRVYRVAGVRIMPNAPRPGQPQRTQRP